MLHSPANFHHAAEAHILQRTAAPNDAACMQSCTCHPDDNPPVPCAQKYALSDCKASALPVQLLGAEPDFEVVDGPLLRLMREIADEACRVDIECHARFVGDGAGGPVYDTSQLEPGHLDDPEMIESDRQAIARAVRYLDMRGKLVRTVPGFPSLVSIKGA